MRFTQTLKKFTSDKLLVKLFANAGRLFAGNIGASIVSLAAFALTARSLGAGQFGILTIATTYAAIVTRLFGFQSWHALVRFGAPYLNQQYLKNLGALFGLGFLLDTLAALIGATVALSILPIVASALDWSSQTETTATWYSITILFGIIGTPTAILRLLDKFSLIAVQQIVAAVIRLLGCIYCMIFLPTFVAFMFVWLISPILGNLILVLMSLRIAKKADIHIWSNVHKISAVYNLKLMRFFLLSNIDGTLRISRELDVQIVGSVVGEDSAGILRIAKEFAFVVGKFMDGFFNAIYPELAMLWSDNKKDEFRRIIRKSSVLVGTIGVVAFMGFSALGQFIIIGIFGDTFAPTYTVALIFLIAMVIWGFAQPLPPALMTMQCVGSMLTNHAIAVFIYCLILPFLIDSKGIYGAAIAFVIFQIIWAVLSLLTLHSKLKTI